MKSRRQKPLYTVNMNEMCAICNCCELYSICCIQLINMIGIWCLILQDTFHNQHFELFLISDISSIIQLYTFKYLSGYYPFRIDNFFRVYLSTYVIFAKICKNRRPLGKPWNQNSLVSVDRSQHVCTQIYRCPW